MGVTYRATDHVLSRDVALKVIEIPSGLTDSPALRARFLREARSTASLRHPNVAEVFQFGTSPETGQAYYAMQLVDGETLEERVRREGPLPVETALEIAVQVAHALVAAAGQGLVHRDLKPANIMLSHAGLPAALQVTVIDFGLASALAGTENPTRLTEGGFVGTPAFASPEQFRGEPADARSDIYSLGVTLWYTLTGRPPFAGQTTEELRDHPGRVTLPVAQLQARKVSAPVVALLRATLATDPARRPASARALLTALETCRRRPRGRLALVIASTVGALVVIGSFWSLGATRSVGPTAVNDKSIAVLPFDNFSADQDSAFFADGVQDEVLADLARVADLKVISRASVLQYKDAKQRNLREIGKDLGVAYVLEGSVQRAGDKIRVVAQLIDARTDAHRWAEHYDRDLQDVFAIQSDIAQAIADQLRSYLSPAEKNLFASVPTTDLKAYELYTQARAIYVWANPDGATGSLRKKTALLEKTVWRDPGFALAYCELSKTYDDCAGMMNDRPYLELARQAAEKALQIRPGLGEAHRELARCYLATDSGRAYDEAVVAVRTLPNDAEAHRIVGEADQNRDHWAQALPEMEKAHELDPSDYEIEYHLAELRLALRRYAEMEQALLNNRPVSRMDTNWVDLLVAESKLARGDPDAARDYLARVQPDYLPTSEFPSTRFDVAFYLRDYAAAERAIAATPARWMSDVYEGDPPQTWNDGMLARLRGDERKARAIFTALLEWTPPAGWEEERKERVHLSLLSRCDAALGRKEDAIREARQITDKYPLAKYPQTAKACKENLALVYALIGERAQAIDGLETLSKMDASISYGDLRCNPYWDALRGDPRFEAMVASLAPK